VAAPMGYLWRREINVPLVLSTAEWVALGRKPCKKTSGQHVAEKGTSGSKSESRN